jgi:hypothetical protein
LIDIDVKQTARKDSDCDVWSIDGEVHGAFGQHNHFALFKLDLGNALAHCLAGFVPVLGQPELFYLQFRLAQQSCERPRNQCQIDFGSR